jgi:hypothetical protein
LAISNERLQWTMSMADERYFTVEEANRLIPQIQGLVTRLRQGQQRLHSHRQTAEATAHNAAGNGGGRDAGAYLADYSQSFARTLAQLQALGVLVKDIEQGLIDFPHWRDGREVYLCWKYGEERIDYWHETGSGYSGRQPL